ncbi:hypothetical protein BDV30DRAFT_244500 [Aspergillus minisclerotigenes]|uniref:Uncharacterized protein n=1 Tax=Aspergillus minisclerotigenes TaxID=656917 RepID=A0A5N6IM18_9EURO|nr:hypothetical protein BDV30DRAFT_244500 [Aspergillus minisclerotigenes]
MSIKYLITGAAGGLGGQVLEYFASFIPLSEFAAASSKPENKSCFDNRLVNKFVHQGPAANGGKHLRLVEVGIVKPP